MATNRVLRPWLAGAVGLAGLLLALAAGAPLLAATLAFLGGAVAIAFVHSAKPTEPEPVSQTEAEPAASLPEASDLLEAIDDPMLIVRDRRILHANAAAIAVLGEHIKGTDVRLAIRHPAAAELLTDRVPANQGEIIARTELVGLGELDRRWEMLTSRLGDGTLLVRLTDRSEQFASEQMRVDFVANASHELRTPLATILGFLETLSEEDSPAAEDPATRSRFIRIMFDEARRIRQLVDDLISLSRIEAERFSPPREPVALLQVVEEVRSACANLLRERGGEILVDNRIGVPTVLGDRTQLVQMLQNLVVNALKYGEPGTPVTIEFEEAAHDMLLLNVTDLGEGIAPEHLPRLTERFYRVDASRSRSMGGTGLGLAIVKHIVHRHRGRLEIRSQLGEGTSVRIYLPHAPATLSLNGNAIVTDPTPNRLTGSVNPP